MGLVGIVLEVSDYNQGLIGRSKWSGNPKRAAPPERLEPLIMDKLREQVIGGSIEIPEELYQRSEPIVKLD